MRGPQITREVRIVDDDGDGVLIHLDREVAEDDTERWVLRTLVGGVGSSAVAWFTIDEIRRFAEALRDTVDAERSTEGAPVAPIGSCPSVGCYASAGSSHTCPSPPPF